MKKVILVVALAALLVPVAALADDSPAPTPAKTANQLCQADKAAMGTCVSAKVHDTVTTTTEKVMKAAKTCKAMRKSDAAGFATKYGAKANAFGKCVAAKGK